MSVHKIKYCCISFDSYIKPQLRPRPQSVRSVVYLLIPTSNHNMIRPFLCFRWLYIFWFLHQTTTLVDYASYNTPLYIFWFLHQTTTTDWVTNLETLLYIFWFLHQTTTVVVVRLVEMRCISFDSYIKPQRCAWSCKYFPVVYLLIPTSNHNYKLEHNQQLRLYIFWFLHQTTTMKHQPWSHRVLYIFWFLHQTTTFL